MLEFTHEDPLIVGSVITSAVTGNTYRIGGRIGEGYFGVVYECSDGWDNELAAKVLKPLDSHEAIVSAGLEEFQKLIELRHPYITYVFDAFEVQERVYLITERCHCPLSELFRLKEFDGQSWVRPIARCLLQAVHFAHVNQYAHQDIHVGNVFAAFAKDEMDLGVPGALKFKLGDLGVAKLFSEIDASNTRAVWMEPPEVLNEMEFGPLDQRIDLYHCGLLFLHILQGREIRFSKEDILSGVPRQLALQLPAPYNFALEKALRRHVQFRTGSALELWRDLNSPLPNPAICEEPQQLALPPVLPIPE